MKKKTPRINVASVYVWYFISQMKVKLWYLNGRNMFQCPQKEGVLQLGGIRYYLSEQLCEPQ